MVRVWVGSLIVEWLSGWEAGLGSASRMNRGALAWALNGVLGWLCVLSQRRQRFDGLRVE